MKLVFTLVWSFLLVSTLNYVVSSVNAVPFDFKLGAILSVGFAVMIYIISSIIPNDPVTHENH
ncbi:YjzD family protein [Paenisporosarcina sp. TG20]|uniref:YjzD family protein n=1 Tax=Paenisporosarcina sp. TG20 TaxID=1211706 RepID=UPI0002E5CBC8|nr:YjzD family protein [Paenisporosarcina sp. TG20]